MTRFISEIVVGVSFALSGVSSLAYAADGSSPVHLPILLDLSQAPGLNSASCVSASYFAANYGVNFIKGDPAFVDPICKLDGNFAPPILNGLTGFGYVSGAYSELQFSSSLLPNVTKVQFLLSVTARSFRSNGTLGPIDSLAAVVSDGMQYPVYVSLANGAPVTIVADPGKYISYVHVLPVVPSSPAYAQPALIMQNIFIDGENSVDLSLKTPVLSQAGALVNAGGSVVAGVPVHVDVPIEGSGFRSVEDRTTTVTLQFGSRAPLSQTVALSDVKSAGTYLVGFDFTFEASDLGALTLNAAVDPGKLLLENNLSNNASSLSVSVIGKYHLALSLSQAEVTPLKTPGNHQSVVKAAVTADSPLMSLAGKVIHFSALAQEFSGGHQHGGGRPAGIFDFDSCTTGVDGTCSVTYQASEISGQETISGLLGDDASVVAQQDIQIKVAGLEALPLSANYSLFSSSLHPNNHFVALGVSDFVSNLASFYKELFSADPILEIGDASLEFGGLFDSEGTWAAPHKGHRTGHDINVSAGASATSIPEKNYGEFRKLVKGMGGRVHFKDNGKATQHFQLSF